MKNTLAATGGMTYAALAYPLEPKSNTSSGLKSIRQREMEYL